MRNKYTLNEDYFSFLTLENCYYAGFIAADGCISKNGNVLGIGLSSKDKQHLVNFLSYLECNAKIYHYRKNGLYDSDSVSITSKKLCDDLNKNFNITPKKSLTYIPPYFDNNDFKDAFITGIIDGDGTVSFTKGKNRTRLYISVMGTLETILFIKKRFEEILGHTTSNPNHNKEHSGNTYTIRVSDKSARILFEHFYGIKTPKLERKWKTSIHEYCITFTRSLPISRRKGVNIFNLNGELIKHFDTLQEASTFSNVGIGRISELCRESCNNHMSNGYMFSRDKTEMEPYVATNPFSRKMLKNLL